MAPSQSFPLIVVGMAIKIADDAARSDIECNCAFDFDGGPAHWCDTTTIRDDATGLVNDALIYLDARGLLDRHPTRTHLVRPRSIGDTINAPR